MFQERKAVQTGALAQGKLASPAVRYFSVRPEPHDKAGPQQQCSLDQTQQAQFAVLFEHIRD